MPGHDFKIKMGRRGLCGADLNMDGEDLKWVRSVKVHADLTGASIVTVEFAARSIEIEMSVDDEVMQVVKRADVPPQ